MIIINKYDQYYYCDFLKSYGPNNVLAYLLLYYICMHILSICSYHHIHHREGKIGKITSRRVIICIILILHIYGLLHIGYQYPIDDSVSLITCARLFPVESRLISLPSILLSSIIALVRTQRSRYRSTPLRIQYFTADIRSRFRPVC